MAQKTMYPITVPGLVAVTTQPLTQNDTLLYVDHIEYFDDATNLVTIKKSATEWEVCKYTAKTVDSGTAGHLTLQRSGDEHLSSAPNNAAIDCPSSGVKVFRGFTVWDYEAFRMNILDIESGIVSNTATLTSLSGRKITAGEGLSGGGDLSKDVSFGLDLSKLPVVTTPEDTDYIPFRRGTSHGRIKKSDLFGSTDSEIFGFAWNINSSNPVLTRIDENGDTINPLQSKFDRHPLWGQIKRCLLTAVGVATYGTNNAGADLDTTKDYVMVEIPQSHIMEWTDGDYRCYCLSNQAFSSKPAGNVINSVIHPWFYQRGNTPIPVLKGYIGAYKASVNGSTSLSSKSGVAPLVNIDMATFESRGNGIGTGWGITNFWFQSLLQLLMYTEFGNFNIQSALGPGFTNTNNTGPQTCGANDSLMNPYGSGGGSDIQGVSYRGINNPYGDIWEFRMGYNSLDDRYRVLNRSGIGTTATIPATLTTTGSEDTTGVTPIRSTNTYISGIINAEPLKLAFIPSALGGSESTYLCDYFYSHVAGQVGCILAGGAWGNGGGAGPGCLTSNGTVSVVGLGVGARLEFLKGA